MFVEMKTLEEQLVQRVNNIYHLSYLRTTTCKTFFKEVMCGVFLFLRVASQRSDDAEKEEIAAIKQEIIRRRAPLVEAFLPSFDCERYVPHIHDEKLAGYFGQIETIIEPLNHLQDKMLQELGNCVASFKDQFIIKKGDALLTPIPQIAGMF